MNSYRTILAVARDPGNADRLFAHCFELAGRWTGHVAGMYAATPIAVHPALRGRQLEDWMASRLKDQADAGDKIKACFETARRKAQSDGEWRDVEAAAVPDTQRPLQQARCADLAVICRGRSDSDFMDPDLTLEDLLMASGRPVLVLPGGLPQDPLGQRIVIAWNGSREAARAVHDAMPLLATAPANSVQIICPGESGKSGLLPLGADLAQSLSRHGISATVDSLDKRHINAGPDVLAKAQEMGADLLVMGAWGHSRLREFVLGGATDTVLRDCKIPVLMSH